jgi:hypothetical protein
VRGIDHDTWIEVLRISLDRGRNRSSVEVRAAVSSTVYNVEMRVAFRVDDGCKALFGNTCRAVSTGNELASKLLLADGPRNECGDAALCIPSRAILIFPEEPFLNPMGNDRPDTSCRCTCDSVVRAPTAPQEYRSARN